MIELSFIERLIHVMTGRGEKVVRARFKRSEPVFGYKVSKEIKTHIGLQQISSSHTNWGLPRTISRLEMKDQTKALGCGKSYLGCCQEV